MLYVLKILALYDINIFVVYEKIPSKKLSQYKINKKIQFQDFFVAMKRMMVGARHMRDWVSVELEKQPWMKAVVAQIFPLADVNIEFKQGQIATYGIWMLVMICIAKYQNHSVLLSLTWTFRCMVFEVFTAWIYETFGFAMVIIFLILFFNIFFQSGY